MQDQWVDVGHEDNELKPYAQPSMTTRTPRGQSGWCPWATHGKGSRSPDGPEVQQSEGHLFALELAVPQAGGLHHHPEAPACS